jgi:hypothetical protein
MVDQHQAIRRRKNPPSAIAEPNTVHLHTSTFRARGWTTNGMNNSLVAYVGKRIEKIINWRKA